MFSKLGFRTSSLGSQLDVMPTCSARSMGLQGLVLDGVLLLVPVEVLVIETMCFSISSFVVGLICFNLFFMLSLIISVGCCHLLSKICHFCWR